MLRVPIKRRTAAVQVRMTVVRIHTSVVQIRTTDARSLSASLGVVFLHEIIKLATLTHSILVPPYGVGKNML